MVMRVTQLTFLFIGYLVMPIFSFAQQVATGKIVDPYGEPIVPKFEMIIGELISRNGAFEMQFDGSLKFNVSHVGHFTSEITVSSTDSLIDLGIIYMIENQNWLDGPKNGVLKDYYPSGKLRYKREIKKWNLYGVSEFYSTRGELTQRILFERGRPKSVSILQNGTLSDVDLSFDKRLQIVLLSYK